MKFTPFACLLVVSIAAAACSSSDDTTPPPTSESLFDNAPAPTEGKLRGLWQLAKQTQAGGEIEIRVRFIESYAVGAAKCTPTGGGAPVIAGKSIAMETTGLDAASGKLTMGALVMSKTEGTTQCGGGIQNSGTFDFKVEGPKLTLTLAGAQGAIEMTKLGD